MIFLLMALFYVLVLLPLRIHFLSVIFILVYLISSSILGGFHLIIYPKGSKSKLINYFWFEIYPDSAPEDWFDILESLMVQFVVSPLHDKDLKKDGTAKKPHYHVIVLFDGGKSPEFVQSICDQVGGANGYIEVIVDKKKAIRYLTHIDFPKKYQYSRYDIIASGVSISKYFDDIDDDFHCGRELIEMRDFIITNRIWYYSDLIDYCMDSRNDWFSILRKGQNAAIIKDYIKSYCYKMRVIQSLNEAGSRASFDKN